MFGIELVTPFLIFTPRRFRLAGGWSMLLLQFLILLTGNYCFFNFLTITLILLLFDDASWPRMFRRRLPEKIQSRHVSLAGKMGWAIAALLVIASGADLLSRWGILVQPVRAIEALDRVVSPFHLTSNYGLFAVMTTTRLEIILEGSNDGQDWKPYEFPYKPGDVRRRPMFVAPHQPRLDWQMWFAVLGDYRESPWFEGLCVRILQGSPAVLKLLSRNPFPGSPPKYLRAELYDYRFTTSEERRQTGQWWKRELKGEFCPRMSLSRG
jgi:hypothetical protein